MHAPPAQRQPHSGLKGDAVVVLVVHSSSQSLSLNPSPQLKLHWQGDPGMTVMHGRKPSEHVGSAAGVVPAI